MGIQIFLYQGLAGLTVCIELNWWVDQRFVDLRNRTVLNPFELIMSNLPTDKVYIIFLHVIVPNDQVFLS